MAGGNARPWSAQERDTLFRALHTHGTQHVELIARVAHASCLCCPSVLIPVLGGRNAEHGRVSEVSEEGGKGGLRYVRGEKEEGRVNRTSEATRMQRSRGGCWRRTEHLLPGTSRWKCTVISSRCLTGRIEFRQISELLFDMNSSYFGRRSLPAVSPSCEHETSPTCREGEQGQQERRGSRSSVLRCWHSFR